MASRQSKKASHEDWHPADIIAALHKRGFTLRDVAYQHGLRSSSTLSKAMESSYPANERRIADAIGVHPREIWPSRYYEDGTPKPRGIRGARKLKSTGAAVQRNGNNRVAG